MRRLFLVSVVLVACLALVGCGSSADTGSDAVSTGPDTSPALDGGVVRVVLGWDEPVDMDLEIWDADGQNAVTAAGIENEDVTDGTAGTEYFDFAGDYAEGEYVVSVYFAEETNIADEANVILTVTKADGSTQTRSRTIAWEEGSDQWHAFKIDGATGEIEDVDEIVETEVKE